jgi:hypothetical protein
MNKFVAGLQAFVRFLFLPTAAVATCIALFGNTDATVDTTLFGLVQYGCDVRSDESAEADLGPALNPSAAAIVTFAQQQRRIDPAACGPLVSRVWEQVRDASVSARRFAIGGSAFLALIPFVLVGMGRARDRAATGSSSAALTDAMIQAALAFVLVYTFMYVFQPYGVQASLLLDTLRQVDPSQADGTPLFLSFSSAPFRHVASAFLGWYTHTLMLVFHRYYLGDTRGSRIWAALFRRLFLVLAIGTVFGAGASEVATGLPGAGGHQELIVLFLIGATPSSALLWLREMAARTTGAFKESGWPLASIPGLSNWHILRLEEEGIHDTADLASADRRRLLRDTVLDPDLLSLWQGTAVLASILGPDAYARLRPFCTTADGFLERLEGPDRAAFEASLAETCDIRNAEEIRTIILKGFGHTRNEG